MNMEIFITGVVGFAVGYIICYLVNKDIIEDYNRLKLENETLKSTNKQYSKLNKILNIRLRKYKKVAKDYE